MSSDTKQSKDTRLETKVSGGKAGNIFNFGSAGTVNVFNMSPFGWALSIAGIVVAVALYLRPPFGGVETEKKPDPTPPPPVTKPETTYLRGIVRTSSGTPVPDAEVEIDLLPGRTFMTTTDGHFDIQGIPAKVGDQARIYARKSGYRNHNQYIALPGPVTINLEKTK